MARPRRTPATAEPSVVHARPEKQLAVTHDQHPSPAPSDPAGLNPSQLQHHEPPGAVRAEREPGPGLFSQDSDLFLDPQIGAIYDVKITEAHEYDLVGEIVASQTATA